MEKLTIVWEKPHALATHNLMPYPSTAKVFNVLWEMMKKGFRDSTIKKLVRLCFFVKECELETQILR